MGKVEQASRAEVNDWRMIGVGVPIGQEVAGPKKRALFGHRSAHRARQGEGRFQPRNGLTPTPGAHARITQTNLTTIPTHQRTRARPRNDRIRMIRHDPRPTQHPGSGNRRSPGAATAPPAAVAPATRGGGAALNSDIVARFWQHTQPFLPLIRSAPPRDAGPRSAGRMFHVDSRG